MSFLVDNEVGKPSPTNIAVLWQDLFTDLLKEIRKDFLGIRRVCTDYHNLSQKWQLRFQHLQEVRFSRLPSDN